MNCAMKLKKISERAKFLYITNMSAHMWQNTLEEALSPWGELVCASERESVGLVGLDFYNLIIIDSTDVADAPGLIKSLHMTRSDAPVVVVTAATTWRSARANLQAGALDYIGMSLDLAELREAFKPIFARLSLQPD